MIRPLLNGSGLSSWEWVSYLWSGLQTREGTCPHSAESGVLLTSVRNVTPSTSDSSTETPCLHLASLTCDI